MAIADSAGRTRAATVHRLRTTRTKNAGLSKNSGSVQEASIPASQNAGLSKPTNNKLHRNAGLSKKTVQKCRVVEETAFDNPAFLDTEEGIKRKSHSVFDNPAFCNAQVSQLASRTSYA